ncbi:MAG TPA: preprotein translocase subunit SecY [Rhodospirillaceae bacterium]|nr:preprotein translocase subunit SecY [Rhodospirillaceae bacterium]
MASAAEQMAANFNMGSFGKAKELHKRIWFTLGALIVYRLGTFLPIPGIDVGVLQEIFRQNAGGLLGVFDMFAGGAVQRMAIFALNIMPYISASIIMQLVGALVPSIDQLRKEGGEQGRRKINEYTRYLTVVIAAFQAYGIAVGLTHMTGPGGAAAVLNPGAGFIISTVITLVGATMFLMWLGEQITSRGIGNGISLLIFAGIVAGLPQGIGQALELGRTGAIPIFGIIILFVGALLILAFIVFMERGHRKVLVQYPKRQVGMKMTTGESSHMPLKINASGVMGPIFASSILALPMTLSGFTTADSPEWMQWIAQNFHHGKPVYMAIYGLLIIFFCFFYTSIIFNPTETADNLKKNGGFVPGIRPGKNTADYFDFVLTRLTVIGAAYIVMVCLLPELLIGEFGLPFYFGGTSLLIVVSVGMDTVAQIHSHMIAHQYEGLIKKSRLRGTK